MSNEITIRISREQLLQLKQTIDREKLKAECDLKYFNPDDLFSNLIDCCLKNGWLIILLIILISF